MYKNESSTHFFIAELASLSDTQQSIILSFNVKISLLGLDLGCFNSFPSFYKIQKSKNKVLYALIVKLLNCENCRSYFEKQGKGMILPSNEFFNRIFMIIFCVQQILSSVQMFSTEQHHEYKNIHNKIAYCLQMIYNYQLTYPQGKAQTY